MSNLEWGTIVPRPCVPAYPEPHATVRFRSLHPILCWQNSEVNPDTVVCIIEAMKVMNEIKAEAKGVVTEVLVENAKPVEFGQPLFKLRPT